MNIELKPMQVLVLWKMLFRGKEPKFSEVKPDTRKGMLEAGLVEVKKRGRSSFMFLTDKAWDWAAEHLDAEVSNRSPQSGPVLQAVLAKLKTYMQRNRISLADIFASKDESITTPVVPPTPVSVISSSNLEARIRSAYLQISGGQTRVRVHLFQMRKLLADIPRLVLDKTLEQMKIAERLILYPLDDPQEITPADEEAALIIAGRKNHIVIFEG